jgi:hypothetical protein
VVRNFLRPPQLASIQATVARNPSKPTAATMRSHRSTGSMATPSANSLLQRTVRAGSSSSLTPCRWDKKPRRSKWGSGARRGSVLADRPRWLADQPRLTHWGMTAARRLYLTAGRSGKSRQQIPPKLSIKADVTDRQDWAMVPWYESALMRQKCNDPEANPGQRSC